MGTDPTPPDLEPSQADNADLTPRHPSERLRKAVANENTNGAPRPQQSPDPLPDAIVFPTSVPR